MTASPSARSTGDWQTGHAVGMVMGLELSGRRFNNHFNDLGITSPARRTIT